MGVSIDIEDFDIKITKVGIVKAKIFLQVKTGFAYYAINTERSISEDQTIDEAKKKLIEEEMSKDFENISKQLKEGKYKFQESI